MPLWITVAWVEALLCATLLWLLILAQQRGVLQYWIAKLLPARVYLLYAEAFWFVQHHVHRPLHEHLRRQHAKKHPVAPAGHNAAAYEQMSFTDHLASEIADFIFTFPTFVVFVVWFLAWIAINSVPFLHHFDPGPGYVLLLFISNFVQLSLMPLIGIAGNLQGKHAERRAEAMYQDIVQIQGEQKWQRAQILWLHEQIVAQNNHLDAQDQHLDTQDNAIHAFVESATNATKTVSSSPSLPQRATRRTDSRKEKSA